MRPVRFGAHVKARKGLVSALNRGADIGAEVIQIHSQSPRMWRPSQHGPEELSAYREAQARHPSVRATFCHATYLINLATTDPDLAAKSRTCLEGNLATATRMGSAGLVLHVGSHRGSGFRPSVPRVADALVRTMNAISQACDPLSSSEMDDGQGRGAIATPILLENTAGAGHTVGRSFEELAAVIEAAEGDERLGICLDTQHLWASGVPFSTAKEADALVRMVSDTVGLGRLQCLHVNDSKVPFGANRDRHANIGEGDIGADGFVALLGHPKLQGLPAILEVPGAGDGPRAEDVTRARELWRRGLVSRS